AGRTGGWVYPGSGGLSKPGRDHQRPPHRARRPRGASRAGPTGPPPAPPRDMGPSAYLPQKNKTPPKYPPAAFRAGVQGEVILIVDVDANGNVTNVSVEKSSRNRDLDRAAMDAARKWKFNASTVNGQKAAGRARVPVNFALN
ncbi:energy transducer TonB, partial [Xanthomonas oryzae]|uniref:energy transducer TonB n=1 Tax=Xanthomonas oryzae TaxID=347 RepID=UPI003F6DCCE6